MKFRELREKFNQRVPSGKKLVDMEVFLDDKDIKQALMILTSQLKRDKLTHNKKMINVKRGDMGKADVMINAIDEGDRWRLIVLKNAPDMSNRKEVDLSSSFMAIQKLPSAQFKGMYAEETFHRLREGTWALPKTSKQKKELKDLLKKPIKLGKDGDEASDKLYNLIGDDELFDDIYVAGKKNPNGDAREIVKKHMKRLGIK
mgnify:CR=1 FL=1